MTRRLFLACLLVLGVTGALAQEARIGSIDMRRIEKESVPFVRALDAMKKEFAPREQQIIEFQKQINADKERFDKERDKLPEAERRSRGNALGSAMRKSDQMTRALGEDIQRRRREILGKLFSEVSGAVKAVAEAGKYDLVLEQATYVRPGLDITDQVLKEMARQAGGAR